MPKRTRCPHCDRLFNRDALDTHIQKCRARLQETHEVGKRAQMQKIVVDGNNVAYHLSSQGLPKARNLVLAYHSLRSVGFEPIFVVSAALIHDIDDPGALNTFMISANVIETPRGTNDDRRIIQLAKKLNVDIVSNDRYLDWIDRYPWITSRLRKYRMTPTGLILTK